jgi:hypothetical protein
MFMRPQPLFTYGQCVAYSDGTAERLVAVGDSCHQLSRINGRAGGSNTHLSWARGLASDQRQRPSKETLRAPAGDWG